METHIFLLQYFSESGELVAEYNHTEQQQSFFNAYQAAEEYALGMLEEYDAVDVNVILI